MCYRILIVLVPSLLLMTAPLRADVVFTTDGSRFVGRIDWVAEGKLRILTAVVGKLEIDVIKINSIGVEASVYVKLDDGTLYLGTITGAEGQAQTVLHTAQGDISINAARIAALWPEGAESPETRAKRLATEAERERLRPKWTASLQVGGQIKEGNNDTRDVRGSFKLERRTPDRLMQVFGAADYSEEEDVRTTNEYRAGIRLEKSLSERVFRYSRLVFEYDEFEDLDLRTTIVGGLGYYWLKAPDHELKTVLGLGYRNEKFTSGGDSGSGIVDLGYEYRADLTPWAQLTMRGSYTPGIDNLDAYLLEFDSAVIFPFKDERWKLKLGVRNEYNSRPKEGIERLDNTYYADIVLTLK